MATFTPILGIDPGSEHSAFVRWDGDGIYARECSNDDLCTILRGECGAHVAIENVTSFGPRRINLDDLLATARWVGVFSECAGRERVTLIARTRVKAHLCGGTACGDPDVRAALIDRWGGALAAIGTRKAPGPLHGVKGHCWQALAVAVTLRDWLDRGSLAGVGISSLEHTQ